MFRLILLALCFLVVLSPQIALAESIESLQEKRHSEISQLAEKIIHSDFKMVTFTARGSTVRDALVKTAYEVREHLDNRSISPLMCKCLNSVEIITNEEYALFSQWEFDTSVVNTVPTTVELEMTLDQRQLAQVALFNMWPLQEASN